MDILRIAATFLHMINITILIGTELTQEMDRESSMINRGMTILSALTILAIWG